MTKKYNMLAKMVVSNMINRQSRWEVIDSRCNENVYKQKQNKKTTASKIVKANNRKLM